MNKGLSIGNKVYVPTPSHGFAEGIVSSIKTRNGNSRNSGNNNKNNNKNNNENKINISNVNN